MQVDISNRCFQGLCSNGRHFIALGTLVLPNSHASIRASDEWKQIESSSMNVQEVLGAHIATLLIADMVAITYKAPASSQHIYVRFYLGTTQKALQNPSKRKHVNSAAVRESWEMLFQTISRNPHHWGGKSSMGSSMQHHFKRDMRTLSEIFTDMPPPLPKREFLDNVDDIAPLLQHPLYSFQRATVAQMLEQEGLGGPQIDPTFIQLHSIEEGYGHSSLWIQPSTMEVCMEPPCYMSKDSGAILAEEMGAGKTVILLALIMATRDQIAQPDEGENENTVLTSLSMRYSQSEHHRQLRRQHSISEPDGMPSLVEEMLHYVACRPNCITDAPYRIREAFNSSSLAPLPPRLPPFYFDHGSYSRGIRKAQKNVIPPIKLYISHATLVVVPASLYEQWKGEIYKFCRDGTLKVLFAKDINYQLPRAADLATYDLVLSTMEWLSTTNRYSATNAPEDICRCPGDILYPNIPLCTCQDHKSVSPIFRCRWKRLVVDEGHNSAHLTTECSTAASKLSIEHRWIVTGTPTQNLTGSIATPKGREVDNLSEETNWTIEDDKDMRRLGNMIGRYLRVEPFYSQREYFDRHVSLPLRKGWRGGRVILDNVLKRCIIRHPIEVVEAEVNLPPMTQEVVLLRLEPPQLRTYNVIQSTIVTNAIDSERTDEDYIFHPRNAKFLQTTFTNLLQSLFWHADQEFFDQEIESHSRNARESIGRAIERSRITNNDFELLKDANKILDEAVNDGIWRANMQREDVPYLAVGIDSQVQAAFSRFGEHVPLYHPDRLLRLRNAVSEDVDIDTEKLLLVGAETERQDVLKEVFVQMHKDSTKNNSRKASKPAKRNPDAGQIKARTVVKARGNSSLFDAKVLHSSSSKINFIIQEVLRYGNQEKFLIFSSSLLSLLHLSEALQVANIPHLEYTSECTPDQRRANISQFNNVPIYRVFLMELKHGARGLNLVTASRVLFAEPVWAPDVEAQAIKRVHRTGQIRPVVVKTLAIRDTVEQEMLERRAGIVARVTRMPPLTEEVGMRRYIENPKFLMESGNGIDWSIPLVPVINRSIRIGLREVEEGIKSMEMDIDPVEKRKRPVDDAERSAKRVRFISPGR